MKKGFNIKDYTEVKDRLVWYQKEYPDYRVFTEILSNTEDHGSVIVRATLYQSGADVVDGKYHSTGIAEELRDAGFVNKTSHVENAETSAIGRALANINYHGSDKRPSREEMSKVERTKKAKESPVKEEAPFEEENTGNITGDFETKINSFTDTDDLVAWFNKELDARQGDTKTEFREQYLQLVKEKASELYGS